MRWCSLTALLLCTACTSDVPSGAAFRPETSKSDPDGSAPAQPKFKRQLQWNDAAREVRHGDLSLRVESVELGPAWTRSSADDDFAPTAEKFLLVKVTLGNIGPERKLHYLGWGSFSASVNGTTGRLLDEDNHRYASRSFGNGVEVRGRVSRSEDIVQDKPVEDTLVFEPPPPDAGTLRLELPAENVGGSGHIRLEIPATAIDRK